MQNLKIIMAIFLFLFKDFLRTDNGTVHFKNVNNCLNTNTYSYLETSEAVFLVMCDPSMNELLAT
jgi:hypothetical protein